LDAIRQIPDLARSDVGVLILGETGTGKEICAKSIHQLSDRAGHPFVPLNCAALPSTLFESELFGHARGAFTGAIAAARGWVALANGGTLFLDEIGCLELDLQAKLLRFLQDKRYQPLGGGRVQAADVRIVAASNADLWTAVRAGTFRSDLYYRLARTELVLPPLRERDGDILLLAEHFLKSACAETGRPARRLSRGARTKLLSHTWPGNVRELENAIIRAVIRSRHPVIEEAGIVLRQLDQVSAESYADFQRSAKAREKAYFEGLLRSRDGNVTRSAQVAGMERHWFVRALQKHDLRPRC
jgi:transcriptional regulator with GAF, ATPase, and Fis domain